MKNVLMAAATAFGLMAAPAMAVVVNGDFEDTSGGYVGAGGHSLSNLASGPGGNWDVFKTINGWTTYAGAGIEVQTNRTLGSIDANSGAHYIELDSHRSSSNSGMQQAIALSEGTYDLSFYYSPRTHDVNTNGIAYSVLNSVDNTLLAGDITGPSATAGTKVGAWTLVTARFVVGAGDSPVLLRFAATGSQNTLGGFIDDVNVTAVPLPAGFALLLTGLAGLGWMRRRQTV